MSLHEVQKDGSLRALLSMLLSILLVLGWAPTEAWAESFMGGLSNKDTAFLLNEVASEDAGREKSQLSDGDDGQSAAPDDGSSEGAIMTESGNEVEQLPLDEDDERRLDAANEVLRLDDGIEKQINVSLPEGAVLQLAFDVYSGSFLRLQIDAASGSGATFALLKDGHAVYKSEITKSGKGTAVVVPFPVHPGNYIVEITSTANATVIKTAMFTLEDAGAVDFLEEEPNGSTQTPTNIECNKSVIASICADNSSLGFVSDLDIYRFTLATKKHVTMRMIAYKEAYDYMYIHLYDPITDKPRIIWNAKNNSVYDPSKAFTIDFGVLEPGTYSMHVTDNYMLALNPNHSSPVYSFVLQTADAADSSCAVLRSNGTVWSCTSEGNPIADLDYTNRGLVKTLYIESNITSIQQNPSIDGKRYWNYSILSSLEKIVFQLDENGKSACRNIADNTFSDCDYLESVVNLEKTQLNSIGKYAFEECSSLTSISFPSSLNTMGYGVFRDCYALKSIQGFESTNLTELANYTFEGCASIVSLELPASLTQIGTNAFWGCSSLKSLTIPSSQIALHVGQNPFEATLYDIAEENGAWIYVPRRLLSSYTENAGTSNYRYHLRAMNATLPHLNDCTVTIDKTNLVFTGKPITPKVTVSNPATGYTLTEGQDYSLSFSNNINAGTATVEVLPCEYDGDYTYDGVATAQFSIAKAPLSRCVLHNTRVAVFTGTAVTPTVSLADSSTQSILQSERDYQFSCDNNTDVGTATITITGMGNYEGTLNGSFDIVKAQEMYRLYNPNSGEHFYTASSDERDAIVDVGWTYEGVGWMAPVESSVPVYRMYNKIGGEHHYTMDANERDSLVSVGWLYEGIGWFSDDHYSGPVWREYNPNAFTCNHNYTTSTSEHRHLISIGWRNEGIGWYGIDSTSLL